MTGVTSIDHPNTGGVERKASPDLNDALCWLEQAEAIIDYVADQLGRDKRTASVISLSLFGASSLIGLASKAANAENERLHALRASNEEARP